MSFETVLGNTEFVTALFPLEIWDFFNEFFTDTSTDTPCPESERLATTASVTPKTTNSNSVLPNTVSNDIQQHINSANSGDVDIRNLTVTLIKNSLTSGKP
jgi:hypothetical protein